MKYPYPIGITGKALKNKLLIVAKDGKYNFEFNPGIDNIAGTKYLKDIIAIPMRGDNGYIGVIQLINKLYIPISNADIVYKL